MELKGFQCYIDGDYINACKYYIQAKELNPHFSDSNFADIFHRNLCEHNHSQEEAAQLYLEAGSEPNVYSYLMTIDKTLFDISIDDAIQIIVKHWEN